MGAEQDIEMLRRAYSSWARGEFTGPDVWDPEVEFVITGVERRTYTGVEGVTEGWFDFLSAWTDFRVAGVEFIPAGGETYVVFCHLSGRGKESDLPIDADTATLVSVRSGRIVRFEMFWDRAEALEAAGLPRSGSR
jgi:ketosteroid isomerase-like protein